MLTFIDGEPLKAGLLLRGPTVHLDLKLNVLYTYNAVEIWNFSVIVEC